MTKLVLSKFEKQDEMAIMSFDCDFTVTTAGDGRGDCKAGRKIHITAIDVTAQSYCAGVDVLVSVGHDSDQDIYRDTAFERAIGEALGLTVYFREKSMQEDNLAILGS